MRLLRSTYLPHRTLPSPLVSLSHILALTAALFIQHAFTTKEDSISHGHHDHPPSNGALEIGVGDHLETYEPEFSGADRSIIGRAGESPRALGNNAPGILNISQSDSQYWTFPRATLLGPKSPQTSGLPSDFEGQNVSVTRDDPSERELYISLTTCRQPLAKDPKSHGAPYQLKLYVSTSPTNQQPNESNNDYAVPINGGFGCLNISVKNDVHFGVYAPANEGYDGVYNYQLTASIDGFYAFLYNNSNALFVDSDFDSALLYTKNTTNTTNSSDPVFQQWMDRPPVFSLFVQNQDNSSILGLQNSVCGLQNLAQIQNVETVMTAAGDGLPKQQFYVKNLNRSSNYYAIAAMIGNSTDSGSGVVGGGGKVWSSANVTANITTKSLDNCALLYNLSFCTSVAWAAPANPRNFNKIDLGQEYDNYARDFYNSFSYSLQQIPCDTTASAQYSLARNCNDCDAAYREWLCAVTIPRCEDISNPAGYLQPRALNQPFINSSYAVGTDGDPALGSKHHNSAAFSSSRNPMIDAVIKPGPYKEMLPCEDLCYNLTRSCPAALQFACPLEGHGLNYSYGSPHPGGSITCNTPWRSVSGAASLRVAEWVVFYAALATALMATTS